MIEGIKAFLSKLGMEKYYDMFKIKGFDDESDIPYLTTFDLQETIMVTNQQDRMTILSNARLYRPGPEHALHAWLCSNSLGYYFIGFVQSDLSDLKKIAQLSLPNEDLYDELEILLPGHRKRLERAVQRLKLEQAYDPSAETPVSHGWWGKPDCLPQAKFDFLCVKASLFSPRYPNKSAAIDFMVDSGSDVSTVQEDTLKGLNLELIGPVYSCGIHGGNHTNLYKGRIKIGGQELDIEVMGSNYDSLGSRVLRHFRHIIDGHRHIWLKGNYSDPLPAIPSIDFPVASSHPSQNSDRQQVALPIADMNDFEAIPGSNTLQQVTRPLGDGSDVNSETQKMYPKSSSTITDEPPVDSLQPPHPGQSTIHIQSTSNPTTSNHPTNTATHQTIHVSKKPRLSPQVLHPHDKQPRLSPHVLHPHDKQPRLSPHVLHPHDKQPRLSPQVLHPHDKQPPISSKGKHSIKHTGKGLTKSSLSKKHLNSKSTFPESSVPRFSHGTGDKVQTTNSEIRNTDDGVVSESVEKSTGKSDSNVHLGERVSLCSILPSSLRDTDDDVDHLGDPVGRLGAFTLCQRSHKSNGHLIEIAEVENLELDIQNKTPERFSCVVNPRDAMIDFNDVVHIDGLNIDSSVNNSVKINTDRDGMAMVFIPACNEIKEIQLQEMDKLIIEDHLGAAQFYNKNSKFRRKHVHSDDSSCTSPQKIGRFQQS